MRYLILSDIHSNLTALETALKAAEGRWHKVVCLGDLVGYGPDPNEVIDRVRSLGAVTIRGNHDKAVSGVVEGDEFNPVARNALLWTRAQLRPDNREYLEKLPSGPVTIDGFSILHGSVLDEDEYVFSPALALEGLLNAPSPLSFFGHTHLQGGFSLRHGEVAMLFFKPTGGNSFATFKVEPDATYLLNPGSIGQPRDGDPRLGFAIADPENHSVEFWRIPYDIGAVQDRMTKAGLPEPLILRLSFGS
jgi:predicted phosphodiesterase